MAEKKQYFLAVGRRKTATARVYLTPASKETITVNGKTLAEYFPVDGLPHVVLEALKVASGEKFTVNAKIMGGGIKAQAGAMRHAISRALIEFDLNFRKELKHKGFLTRDPRMKERRKFGLKKARRAPQWSKR